MLIFGLTLFFIIEHTMAISLKFGVRHLLAKFPTDALELLGFWDPTGTIAALCLQAFFDPCHQLRILIQTDP